MILRSLLFVCGLAAAVCAQQPRFVLPDVPYDYTEVAAPAGLDRFLFRRGDDPVVRDAINRRAALGRVLFHDPLLSQNRSRSCSSCHQQSRGFADGEALSIGFHGKRTARNTMSIVNLAAHRDGFFWDTRVRSLERMVLMPVQNPIEMGMDCGELRDRLRAAPGYVELFRAAFGNDHLETDDIALALAEFVRSIASYRSKYDEGFAAAQDVDTDFPNFTAAENRGKRLFFGELSTRTRSCAACHVRPQRTCCSSVFVPDPVELCSDACRNNGLDDGRGNDDPGLAAVTGKAADLGKFRAPSLRNVELTAPYMHDGRLATLADVVQFYASRMCPHPQLDPVLAPGKSGGWSAARAPRGAPSAPEPITGQSLGFPMTSREQADLVAFLKTLTDHELARDPRFADPFAKGPAR